MQCAAPHLLDLRRRVTVHPRHDMPRRHLCLATQPTALLHQPHHLHRAYKRQALALVKLPQAAGGLHELVAAHAWPEGEHGTRAAQQLHVRASARMHDFAVTVQT